MFAINLSHRRHTDPRHSVAIEQRPRRSAVRALLGCLLLIAAAGPISSGCSAILVWDPAAENNNNDSNNNNTNTNNNNNNNNNNVPPNCGDGTVDPGEECDNGAANSATAVDACRPNCRWFYCGDGVMDTGETCDDGNTDSNDACLATCEPNTCGDGAVNPAMEECDDGNSVQSDGCNNNCEIREFLVNTTTSSAQHAPGVGVSEDGRIAIAWGGHEFTGEPASHIYFQTYGPDGSTTGVETVASTDGANHNFEPDVAMRRDGTRFVIVWGYNNASDQRAVLARTFDGSGIAQTDELTLWGPQAASVMIFGRVKAGIAGNGNWAATWSWSFSSPEGRIFVAHGALYDAAGTKLADVAPLANGDVTAAYNSPQLEPSVWMLDDGRFTVAWSEFNTTALEWEAHMRRFDANGGTVGVERTVDPGPRSHWETDIAASSASGQGYIVWFDWAQAGSAEIWGQSYDSSGTLGTSSLRIDSLNAVRSGGPQVAMADDGRFVVVWTTVDDGAGSGIHARRFGSDGSPAGAPFQVNFHTLDDQSYPSVAMAPDGRFVIAWSSFSQDGSAEGVFAQRYHANGDLAGAQPW